MVFWPLGINSRSSVVPERQTVGEHDQVIDDVAIDDQGQQAAIEHDRGQHGFPERVGRPVDHVSISFLGSRIRPIAAATSIGSVLGKIYRRFSHPGGILAISRWLRSLGDATTGMDASNPHSDPEGSRSAAG